MPLASTGGRSPLWASGVEVAQPSRPPTSTASTSLGNLPRERIVPTLFRITICLATLSCPVKKQGPCLADTQKPPTEWDPARIRDSIGGVGEAL